MRDARLPWKLAAASWILAPLIFAASTLLASCGKRSSKDPGAPYEAFAVRFQASPTDATAPGRFTFEPRALPALKSLASLENEAFQIVEGGELLVKRIRGSLVEAKQFSGSRAPRLRFHAEGKRIAPLDYSTMALLSAYAQFEEVFSVYARITGLDDGVFRAWFGKAFVLFEPRVRIENGDGSVVGTGKLNAAYVPGARQFLLFQRSRFEQVPLAANLQVVAHEFGHALFEYLFFKGNFDPCSRLEQEWAMRGLNEGFADFFSFAVTGSTDVLRGSFDWPAKADERNFGRIAYRYAAQSSAEAASDARVARTASPRRIPLAENRPCTGGFYCLGSLFANALFESLKELGGNPSSADARAAFFKSLVPSLQAARTPMLAFPAEILPPSPALSGCADAKEDPAYDGLVAGAFFKAFLEPMEDGLRKSLCRKLESNFGALGFPAAARNGPCT